MKWSRKTLAARLAEYGIEKDEAQTEAAILLETFGGIAKEEEWRNPDREAESEALDSAVARRGDRYPLQYILGEWPFYRQTYKVNEHCLIPRPETEILTEKLISLLPKNGVFLDGGTGSGCITVSALAERRDARGYALEYDPDTLRLAGENAERNGVSARFEPVAGDLLSGKVPEKIADVKFDAIVSNPPYITREAMASLAPELSFEPRIALEGGEDGLDFYRAILSVYAPLLREDGFILFEIGFDQGGAIRALAEKADFDCDVIRDYGGCDRVAYLRRRKEIL